MFCVSPNHEELRDEELKGKTNEATHLITIRRKLPKSERYLMVVCERCANNLVAHMRCTVEWWDRVPRAEKDTPPWGHMVLTEKVEDVKPS